LTPETGGTLNELVLLHTPDEAPLMVPGCAGSPELIALHLAALLPQALVADTHTTGAPVYGVGKFTVIEVVFCPLVIVHPDGTVQLYPDAPVTAGTEYTTPVAPGQAMDGPVIAPGTAGFLETNMQRGALVDEPPQESDAVTHN